MTSTRVVLSTGANYPVPRPATLFVTVTLGHAFRALPLDEQRRMVEQGLTDALEQATERVEALHAEQVAA